MARSFRTVIAAAAAVACVVGTVVAVDVGAAQRAVAATAPASVSCTEPGTSTPIDPPALDGYRAINPKRLIDTRDGTGGFTGTLDAGCTLSLQLGTGTVPADAQAVALSLTAIAPERGWVVAFACDAARPATSSLNFRPGGVAVANLASVALGPARSVCVYASARAHVVVDLAGWWGSGPNRFSSIVPVRAYDTRELPGAVRVRAGETRGIDIGGVQVPDDATAVTVNLTVAGSDERGHAVVFPCGLDAPHASNINFLPGEARAVAAIVGLDANGGLCVQSHVDVHVVVDVTGYYAPAPAFGPSPGLIPEVGTRLTDTRGNSGPWTSKFAAGEVRGLDPLTGLGASNAVAVVVNIVATMSDAPGWVALFPCGGTVPFVSTVNFYDPTAATNLAIVELGEDGRICAKASVGTHVVIDRVGHFAPAGGALAERLDVGDRVGFPEFVAGGTDYAVTCNHGATTVTLTIDPVPGATAAVNGARFEPGTAGVPVAADGAFTVVVSRGSRRDTYVFRCVPPDFPVFQVERQGEPTAGWYLTTFGRGGPSAGFLAILDHRGAPVWYKRVDRVPIDLKLWSNGRLAYTPLLGQSFGVDPDSGYRLTDLSGANRGELLTTDPVDLTVDHHDLVEVPGGGRAMLSYPLVPNQDLTAIGFGADETIADGVIEEIDGSGARTWIWRMSDHLPAAPDVVTFARRFALTPANEVDVFHVNSLQRLADGDYLMSIRHTDAAMRVDRSTGEILWSVGGEPAADPTSDPMRRLTIVGDPLGGPRRPHDARLNGDVLTLYDNRTATGQPARAVAYRIDEAARTATLLWEIDEPSGRSSPGLGSTRVQPDGSVLVTWGGLQPTFGEYAPDGTELMSIGQSPEWSSYRIVKVPLSQFSVGQLRANAGGSVVAP